jgi:predicted permease
MVHISEGLAAAAARTVATFMLLMVAGGVCAFFPRRAPLLSPSNSQYISTIAAKVMAPCLSMVTLGANTTPALLRETWPLLLWGFLSTLISFGAGSLVAVAARVEPSFRPMFVMSVTFANTVAVIIVLVQALCNEPQLAQEANCRERAAGFVFLPVIGSTTLFWTLGVHIATAREHNTSRTTGTSVALRIRVAVLRFARGLLNAPMVGTTVGLCASNT